VDPGLVVGSPKPSRTSPVTQRRTPAGTLTHAAALRRLETAPDALTVPDMAENRAHVAATVRARASSLRPGTERLGLLRAYRARVCQLDALTDAEFEAVDWRALEPAVAKVRVDSRVGTSG
jgi:hypothetical protein